MHNKLTAAIHIVFALCVLAFVGNITYELFLTELKPAVKTFTGLIIEEKYYEEWMEWPHLSMAFATLRLVFLLLTFYLGWRFYHSISGGKNFLYKNERRHISGIATSIIANYNEIKAYPKPVKICLGTLFIVQVVMFTFFLFALPYQYDEAWMYTFFSGKSIVTSVTFYPVPNNHVFLNLLSSLTLLLPIDEITAMRLPNYIAAFISTFYFFKLNKQFVPAQPALVSTVLFTFCWPLMFYSAQARGYGLLVMFAVLCIYSYARILKGGSERKYFLLFIVSSALGFFTLPSFLYFFVVINCTWFVSCLFMKQPHGIWRLVKANLSVVIITLLFYTPILGFEGVDKLTENNGVIKRDMAYLQEYFRAHMRDTWKFMMGRDYARLYWTVPVFIGFIAGMLKGAKPHRLFSFACLALLLSPLPIIFLHKVIPFERTWIYLIIPLAAGFGFFINELAWLYNYAVRKNELTGKHLPYGIVCAFIITFGIWKTSRNKAFHEKNNAIDYTIRKYNKMLNSEFALITSIGYPADGMGFYIAEDFRFEGYRRNPNREWPYAAPFETGKQPEHDVIIIDKTKPVDFSLDNYREVANNNEFFRVFLLKK